METIFIVDWNQAGHGQFIIVYLLLLGSKEGPSSHNAMADK